MRCAGLGKVWKRAGSREEVVVTLLELDSQQS
jgi:hypothetical protein